MATTTETTVTYTILLNDSSKKSVTVTKIKPAASTENLQAIGVQLGDDIFDGSCSKIVKRTTIEEDISLE